MKVKNIFYLFINFADHFYSILPVNRCFHIEKHKHSNMKLNDLNWKKTLKKIYRKNFNESQKLVGRGELW